MSWGTSPRPRSWAKPGSHSQAVRLAAVGGDATHGLFIIFSDLTRKTGTYPAGRFLATEAVTDGKVLLDFNRAYNPPCSVPPYAT
jgi:uncharacterized protein (DUF1684 family)